jgi:dihydrolipoamide dehydrogenase
MEKYDLVVIGAGPGGTPAAMAAAQFRKKVLLIDKRGEPGGECLFEGCIPSKVLENAANRYKLLKEASRFHIDLSGSEQIHWEMVLKDKKEIVKKRSAGALMQIEKMPTLQMKQGTATFLDAHTLEVNGEKITFEHAIIATGASAHVPSFNGEGVSRAWTNADVFKEEQIPKEITFIGAGAISCELVQMFNGLGTRCRILERSERILKHVDEAFALKLQQKMLDDGIEIELNITIDSIEGRNGDFTVTYQQREENSTLKTPQVLIATGRTANVEELGLENIGIVYDRKGIQTDDTLQTAQPHIYAVGDCTTGPKFAHWASYQAGIAIHNIFAPSKHKVDPDKLSWVLFSNPQIASVGLSEAEAKARGLDITVEQYDFATDARAQIDKETLGELKFIIDKTSSVTVGIQILSEDASSLSGEAALIVANKMKAMDVMKTIHPHPTLTESFGKLSQSIFMKMMMRH